MNYEKAIEKLGSFTELLRRVPKNIKDTVTDIKITANKPILLCCRDKLYYLLRNGAVSPIYSDACFIAAQSEIETVFHKLCGYSVYSHMDEIRRGYISADRSLRVGISGTGVAENGELKAVREITGFSIRIPRQIIGCAEKLFELGMQPEQGILIAGAPSAGKTTLLRDLARILGNSGKRTVVLDERFELFSDGFDLGMCTDVLQGYPKVAGFSHAIRCLSPEFILCDELDDADLPAVSKAAFAGVTLAATVHAGNADELRKRPLCRKLLESGVFGYIVLLQRHAANVLPKVLQVGDVLETMPDAIDRSVRPWHRAG